MRTSRHVQVAMAMHMLHLHVRAVLPPWPCALWAVHAARNSSSLAGCAGRGWALAAQCWELRGRADAVVQLSVHLDGGRTGAHFQVRWPFGGACRLLRLAWTVACMVGCSLHVLLIVARSGSPSSVATRPSASGWLARWVLLPGGCYRELGNRELVPRIGSRLHPCLEMLDKVHVAVVVQQREDTAYLLFGVRQQQERITNWHVPGCQQFVRPW